MPSRAAYPHRWESSVWATSFVPAGHAGLSTVIVAGYIMPRFIIRSGHSFRLEIERERPVMKIECRNRVFAAVAVVVLGLLAIGSAQARVLSQWVELGPEGTSSVRA